MDQNTPPDATRPSQIRDGMPRVGRVVWVVGAVWLFLLLLVVSERLSGGEAIVFGFALLVLALVLPRPQYATNISASDAEEAIRETASVCATADAVAAPAFVLDWKANIIHRNKAATNELPHATIGSPIAFAIRQPALVEAIEQARDNGQAQSVELQQGGTNPVWYAISVAPIILHDQSKDAPDAGGENRLLVILENQSEQRRTEAMRVDFIANASHELRTPLTSIIGFIDTLLGTAANDNAAREKFLKIMRAQADRMANLIEDLLSLSRIELRQHVQPTGEVDMAKIVNDVVEVLQTQISKADLLVNVQISSGETLVTGDQEELYEVVQNLLDNAIKYGAEGGKIDVTLSASANRSHQTCELEVVDYGTGIAPEQVPRLTERFYRVDAESSRQKKGTGLGLAIVKHIISRHRGELTISSEVGKGTRVQVVLPR